MDNIISSPVFQFVIFGVACYVFSFLTRRCFEAWRPSLRRTVEDTAKKTPYCDSLCRWWNEVILYAVPPAWGAGLAILIRKTPVFPEFFREWRLAVLFGVAIGFLSGFVYKITKRLILTRVGLPESTLTIPSGVPDAPVDVPPPDSVPPDEEVTKP